MLKVNPDTTWWSPKPNVVIDARDIASLSITQWNVVKGDGSQVTHYATHVYLSGTTTQDKREFSFTSLEELNLAIAPLGLEWVSEATSTPFVEA